jgi:glutamate-1-semialdehyde 2,1-aminomutase
VRPAQHSTLSRFVRWPDVDAIGMRRKVLLDSKVRPLRRDRVAADLAWFDERCRRSRCAAEEAASFIPGGVQHNLAFSHPFPLEIVRAEGGHVWDSDGNRYVDFVQAGGSSVLGHNDPTVKERVAELVATNGPATGMFHPYELELAKLIHDCVPSVEQFRMLGSGTEGVMAAIRVARAHTGRRHIVKIGGGYHGWSDQVMIGMRLPGTGPLEAKGVPPGAYASTHEVFPNDVDQLRSVLRANAGSDGTAAVILDPVGPESGTWPVPVDYCHEVRELCDEYGALLVFDEVVTGFRLGLGGAQGVLGVTPDLTVFGKCIAGGYPGAGGLGGRQEIMASLAGGLSAVGQRVFVGGTLSAAAVSCAAGVHAILEIDRTDAARLAARAGDRLRQGLEVLIDTYDLPFVAYNIGSIVHVDTTGLLNLDIRLPGVGPEIEPRLRALTEFGAAYTAEGLLTVAGSRLFTCLAHTDDVVDDAIARFARVLSCVE